MQWEKLIFASVICLIPLFFVLGGTIEKGIRRYGCSGLIFVYMVMLHGFHWSMLLAYGATVGLLCMGYGDNAYFSIMPAANKGKFSGYLGVALIGMAYCAINWLYCIAIGWQSSRLLALVPAGVCSLWAFLLHKEVKGKTDRWTIWEALGAGVALAIGFSTIG